MQECKRCLYWCSESGRRDGVRLSRPILSQSVSVIPTLLRMCLSYRYCSWCNVVMTCVWSSWNRSLEIKFWGRLLNCFCVHGLPMNEWICIMPISLYDPETWQRPNGRSCKHSTCWVNGASSTSGTNSPATVKSYARAICGYQSLRDSSTKTSWTPGILLAWPPTVVPASAAFSTASTATDGVFHMSDWKRSRNRPPKRVKTWLKQISLLRTLTPQLLMHFNWLQNVWRSEKSRGRKATRTMMTMLMMHWQRPLADFTSVVFLCILWLNDPFYSKTFLKT